MRLRKAAATVMVLCLSMVLFTGCQKDNHYGLDAKQPTTITVWHYYNGVQQENFDNMVMEFNETLGSELGIVVEASSRNSVSNLADNALEALRQGADAEEAPDMFAAYAETAYIADQMGRLVDLSAYFTKEELDEYVAGYLAEGDLGENGELKIFPTAKSLEVMMLNLTDWQAFAAAEGVTTDNLSTWEELAQTAEKYYRYTDALTPDVPNDGRAFFGRDSVANYMIVGAKQLGLEFFTVEDGSFALNENRDVIRRLWECYYVPYVKGHYYASGRYRSDDAKVGSVIAMVCSTTGAAYFPSAVTLNDVFTYSIDGLVLPVPNFEGTEPYVVQQGAGMVVVKSDKTKEYACAVFLKWFTEKERSIAFSANSGYLPVKKDANNFDAIATGFQSENSSLRGAMRVAVTETDSCHLYAAKPFEKSTEARDFLDSFIQNTAQAAHDEASERMARGEDRETVLAEYCSDEAFDAWYTDFIAGLQSAVN